MQAYYFSAIDSILGQCYTVAILSISLSQRRYLAMLFLHREDGQGLVEYALVLVLVAVVVIAILTLLGPQIGNVFSRITNGLQ